MSGIEAPYPLLAQHREALNDAAAITVLATADRLGKPHAVFIKGVVLGSDGFLEYIEPIETSITNRNLVASLWFKQTVSLLVRIPGGPEFSVELMPYRCLVAGSIYEDRYRKTREIDKDADIAAVWRLKPLGVRDQFYPARKRIEDAAHPQLWHLDRLAVLASPNVVKSN